MNAMKDVKKRRLEGLTMEEQSLQHWELARLKREVARLEEENDFLKSGGVLRESAEARYAMILRHEGHAVHLKRASS